MSNAARVCILFVSILGAVLCGCKDACTPKLEVAFEQLGVGAQEGTLLVPVMNGGSGVMTWSVEVMQHYPEDTDAGDKDSTDWITCAKEGAAALQVCYAANTGAERRAGLIRISAKNFMGAEAGGSPFDIIVSQGAADSSPTDYQFAMHRGMLTMQDGVRLAATYYRPLPRTAGETFPAILELLPYRKDDIFYLGDYEYGSYFAKHGYGIVRVDVRGTGSSEGPIPPCEYSEAEINDGVEIIDQLSKMDWSNGNIGMYGISWSGFNSLMVAARKPPALKAIITAHASMDLFYNDVHYIDGVMHMDYYAQQIDTDNALPVSTDYLFDDAWQEDRFNQEPWLFTWFRNQRDGEFWRSKSLAFKEALQVPAYVIGGLLDGYRDYVAQVCETSKAPVIAEIGPWNHAWPEYGKPGPNYEWRQRALRWWGYWLKGEKNGILEEPRFMVYVRDGHEPATMMNETPGEWRWDASWPISGMTQMRLYPGAEHILSDKNISEGGNDTLVYKAGAGLAAGGWWGELTADMAADDGHSLVYDTQVLSDPVEIIGNPKVSLNVVADAPLYQWSVRLEDVFPDGRVSLVTGALINPSQRESRLDPQPLKPGEPAMLSAILHFTTWRFQAGHRIRLAISNAQFPMAWPTPYKGTTTLLTGTGTWLELPIPPEPTAKPGTLPEPEPSDETPDGETLYSFGPIAHGDRDETAGESTYSVSSSSMWRIKTNYFNTDESYTWSVADDNPAAAKFEGARQHVYHVGGRAINISTLLTIRSDEKNFNLDYTKTAVENGKVIAERNWTESIPRDNQ